jgi:hypothetical protein
LNKIIILGRGEELENVNLLTGFFQTPVNSILFKRKKAKKAKNSEKMRKIAKKVKKSEKKRKNRLEFCFALFRLEAKITQVKRSENYSSEA